MFPGNPGVWVESAVPYSDSTVTRGLLIKFRSNIGSAVDVQFLTDTVPGEKIWAGDTPTTLSVGDGITIGGAATLNVAGKSVDNVSSGTLYQIIWDLGTDSVPEGDYRMLRPTSIANGTARPPGNFGGFIGGAAIQVYTGTSTSDNPGIISSPVSALTTLSDAGVSVTVSPTDQLTALGIITPDLTTSPVDERLIEGLPWPLLRNSQIAYRTLTTDRLINVPVDVLASQTSFDLTQTRVFNLYTTPLGKIGFILGVFVRAIVADTVTVVPQISVGIASGENDIFAQEAMTDFDTVGDVWSNWLVLSKGRNSLPTEIVKLNIVGATATKLLADVYLIGFEY